MIIAVQAKHLRDKVLKLIVLGFIDGIGPAMLSDLMMLFDLLGTESGLTGSVLDMTNSTQNNLRAQEMASCQVMFTAANCFVSPRLFLCHVTEFRDACLCVCYIMPAHTMQVCRKLIKHLPGAIGTAIYVLVSAAHLAVFRDEEGKPPIGPASRLAVASFSHAMTVYQTVAVRKGARTTPPITQWQYTMAMPMDTRCLRHGL